MQALNIHKTPIRHQYFNMEKGEGPGRCILRILYQLYYLLVTRYCEVRVRGGALCLAVERHSVEAAKCGEARPVTATTRKVGDQG